MYARALHMLSICLEKWKGLMVFCLIGQQIMNPLIILLEDNPTSSFTGLLWFCFFFLHRFPLRRASTSFKMSSRFKFIMKILKILPQVTHTHTCCFLGPYSWLLIFVQQSSFIKTSLDSVGGYFIRTFWYLMDNVCDVNLLR